MIMDTGRYISFLQNICRDSNHRTARFWQSYWFDTGHHRRLSILLEKMAAILSQKPKLLDIGSFGEFPLILMKFCRLPLVYANSLEGDILCYGDGRLVQSGSPGIELALLIEQCDVERRPMSQPDSIMDVVTCFEMLEHLRRDPMFMMLEIHRVLREEGHLVLTTPNANSWESLARTGTLHSPSIFSTFFSDGSGIGHVKEYSISELRQLMENAGFAIEQLETFDSLPPNPDLKESVAEMKQALSSSGMAQEEFRGQSIFVHARKRGRPRFRKYIPLYTENVPFLSTPADQREIARLNESLEQSARRIQELETELSAARAHLSRLEADFEGRTRWALSLEKEIREQEAVIRSHQERFAALQAEFDERGKWAQQLDCEVQTQRTVIAALEQKLAGLQR
jgi:SAM-dependent methyltransferase